MRYRCGSLCFRGKCFRVCLLSLEGFVIKQGFLGERETEREREKERERERERETERDQRETERDREREKERQRGADLCVLGENPYAFRGSLNERKRAIERDRER